MFTKKFWMVSVLPVFSLSVAATGLAQPSNGSEMSEIPLKTQVIFNSDLTIPARVYFLPLGGLRCRLTFSSSEYERSIKPGTQASIETFSVEDDRHECNVGRGDQPWTVDRYRFTYCDGNLAVLQIRVGNGRAPFSIECEDRDGRYPSIGYLKSALSRYGISLQLAQPVPFEE